MNEQASNSHFVSISDNSKTLTDELYPHITNYDFDTVPLVWIKNAPIKTFYETYLSITLETLEHFMIDSIKETIQDIADPQLSKNAEAFCQQELNHADQHARFNQNLYKLGVDIDNLKQTQEQLKQNLYKYPLNERLQFIAFLEGITAGFAYELICNRFLMEDWHPQAKELYLWHCIEEYEHRCLAFDVYMQHVKVHKPSLLVVTRTIAPLFVRSLIFMVRNLTKHKLLWTKQTLNDLVWFVSSHGPMFYMLKCYYRFFNKSYNPQHIYFHPKIEDIARKWEANFHAQS